MMADRHRVVIVGGGFGGPQRGRADSRTRRTRRTLVDRTNHHLFQPLLYQVATGILPPGLIAPALRSAVATKPNVRTLLADVNDIDVESKGVHAHGPDDRPLALPYDTLVVAAGATHSYFGNDHFAEFAPGMKTDRGRPIPARQHPGQVRDGRDRHRPEGTCRLADLHRGRGRARPGSSWSARSPSSRTPCCPGTTGR